MPEGDAVWRTARRLDTALAGRVLIRSELRWPTLATADLTGRTVLEVASVGKHLLTRFDSGLTLHSHLRMDGSWRVRPTRPDGRLPPASAPARAILVNESWTATGWRLGLLDLLPTAAEQRVVGHLGPDVLGPAWDPAEAGRRLRAAGDRPVGDALLDQRVLAGVGTIYLAESCHLARINPTTPVAALGDAEVAQLIDAVHRLMAAHHAKGRMWVYGRTGRDCRSCAAGLVVSSPIGQQRTTFYCPVCQPPADRGIGTQNSGG